MLSRDQDDLATDTTSLHQLVGQRHLRELQPMRDRHRATLGDQIAGSVIGRCGGWDRDRRDQATGLDVGEKILRGRTTDGVRHKIERSRSRNRVGIR